MNELPEEIELPPMDYGLAAHEQCDVREAQLKSSLAANREQKAEIERLKEELGKFHEHPHVNKEYGTCPISDVRLAEMCQETKWWKHDDDEIYRVVHELKDSRASLRASVGEKWIAFNEGVEAAAVAVEEGWDGWDGVVARIRREKHPVAPTLPGEEK